MRPSDEDRAKQLVTLLAGREQGTADDEGLIDGGEDFKTFRVRLLKEGQLGPDVAAVVEIWRQEIQRRVEKPDSNELMHALEKLVERQRAIDRDLARIDAVLVQELQALDRSCLQLTALRDKLRHTHASIGQCRASIMQNLPLLAVEA